ncbi:uncharacterized protein LOC128674430 [Plodia interpunctella]|uniref:uncharacterized protein LOC128674430 n=1 Tax=Plodia interpunctella TaxID=58824 RepID=UPI002368DC62|nr:uncharacterized protein LOC128674430 [Plodia interpunctella]
MSTTEEDTIIAPWVGPTCCRNSLTVIVLSSSVDIIEKIADALAEVHAKGNSRWKLIILRSFHLEEVVKQSYLTGKIAIDFVVLAMDTSRIFCLEWTKKVFGQIHPDLQTRRTMLVNASGLPANGMAVNAGDLISFQNELRLDMLSANVYKTEDAAFLARRLIKYMEVSLGLQTGIPNINV